MGRAAKYTVSLSEAERELLKTKSRSRKTNNTIKKRIKIILEMDQSLPNPLSRSECAKKLKASVATVANTLSLYCREGLDGLFRIKRNPNSDAGCQKFDGKDQARVIATACSKTKDGTENWTVRSLAETLTVTLDRQISPTTIHRILKKNEIRPHLTEYWCIPEEKSAEFVSAMEDILDVYERPEDPDYPVWCLDEKPYQLLGEVKEPIPMEPGKPKKQDSEYVKNGHIAIFCMINPNTGQIHTCVEPQRTAIEFAQQLKWLVDVAEPSAKKIILIMDNLNTHKISSLYKAFSPEEASRIRNKIEIHYTPKHGSWLNIAEIGIGIFSRQCLRQRFPTIKGLRDTLNLWETKRNEKKIKINWKFTSKDARVKLKRLYPDIETYEAEKSAE